MGLSSCGEQEQLGHLGQMTKVRVHPLLWLVWCLHSSNGGRTGHPFKGSVSIASNCSVGKDDKLAINEQYQLTHRQNNNAHTLKDTLASKEVD